MYINITNNILRIKWAPRAAARPGRASSTPGRGQPRSVYSTRLMLCHA